MFIVTIFWGMTYVLTKICLIYSTELYIISLRFLLSFIISLLFLWKKIFPIKIKELFYSFILGMILFLVFITMTIGLKYTTATNASFLVSLSVIFIPFFSSLINKEKLKKNIFIILIFVFIGIMLLTLDKNLQFHIGDILCFICSILFAFHVVFVGKFVKNSNPITLGVFQFAYISLFSFLIHYHIEEKLSMPTNKIFWYAIFLLAVFCTSFGYIVQNIVQQKISPTMTGFILSLEPVFSGIFGYIILKEQLTIQQYIGGVLLLFCVIYVSKET
jgi:hypothetical protein